MRVLVRSMVPAAGPVAAYAGGHCAVHDDGARCAKSVGGARARLVVRPRAFHAWAELDRHILYLSGGDAGLARLGGGAAAVAVSRHLSGRGNGAGLRSEEHTSELQSLMRISYAVFCLKKKTQSPYHYTPHNPIKSPSHNAQTQTS